MPSCPALLSPQLKTTPTVVSAQLWASPHAISANGLPLCVYVCVCIWIQIVEQKTYFTWSAPYLNPSTRVGVLRFFTSPWPSWPLAPHPHIHRLPSTREREREREREAGSNGWDNNILVPNLASHNATIHPSALTQGCQQLELYTHTSF